MSIASSQESHYHYPDGFTLDFREKVLGELNVFQEEVAQFEDATVVAIRSQEYLYQLDLFADHVHVRPGGVHPSGDLL